MFFAQLISGMVRRTGRSLCQHRLEEKAGTLHSFQQSELDNSLNLEKGVGNCIAQFSSIYCRSSGQGVNMTSRFLKHSSLFKGRAAREGMFKAGSFLVIHFNAMTS